MKLEEASPKDAGMDPDRISLLRQRLGEWVDGEKERGGVFLVARRGKIVLHEALGTQTDKPDSPPMTRDSIFALSSLTKPVTAAGAMILVEDGLLALNRPVTEYLPELCGEGTKDLEVQHLLTHTSGFLELESWLHFIEKSGATYEMPYARDHSLEDYFDLMWDLKSYHDPGTCMQYCNHNFALLSPIIARVAGSSPIDFFRERFFEPLGMTGATYMKDPTRVKDQVVRGKGAAAGSGDSSSVFGGLEGSYLDKVPIGFAGLNGRAMDMAIFGQCILNGGTYDGKCLLSPASVQQLCVDQVPGIQAEIGTMSGEASWGLGFAIQGTKRWLYHSSTLAPKGTVWHSGNGGSYLWIDPINEVVGVYLSVLMHHDALRGMEPEWHADLFQNMVTAAAID